MYFKREFVDFNSSEAVNVLESLRRYVDSVHQFDYTSQTKQIRLHEPTISGEEIIEAVKVLISTRVTSGDNVKEFEAAAVDVLASDFAVSVNSGSSANLLALSALTSSRMDGFLKAGDHVIVPGLSWATTVWPIVQLGLVPSFVDIDPNTLNICPDRIEEAITPNTKAIMLVHVYGNPCDMSKILEIAQKYNLWVIEDCCEALGAKYEGRHVGSMGDVGTFSFYYSHHVSTMEGGVVVSNNSKLATVLKVQRAHGWLRDVDDVSLYKDSLIDFPLGFTFVDTGFNFRLTELQAAIGKSQLRKLDGYVRHRRKIADRYREELRDLSDRIRIQSESDLGESSYFGMAFTILDEGVSRDHVIESLMAAGIESRPIIAGNMARQPGLRGHKHLLPKSGMAGCDAVMMNGMSLPCHQSMSVESVSRVCDSLRDVFLK